MLAVPELRALTPLIEMVMTLENARPPAVVVAVPVISASELVVEVPGVGETAPPTHPPASKMSATLQGLL